MWTVLPAKRRMTAARLLGSAAIIAAGSVLLGACVGDWFHIVEYPTIVATGEVVGGHPRANALLRFVAELEQEAGPKRQGQVDSVVYMISVRSSAKGLFVDGCLPPQRPGDRAAWYCLTGAPETIERTTTAIVSEIVSAEGRITHRWRRLRWDGSSREWKQRDLISLPHDLQRCSPTDGNEQERQHPRHGKFVYRNGVWTEG